VWGCARSLCAKDLYDAQLIGKQDPYCDVTLDGNARSRRSTPVHDDGGRNPVWNAELQQWVLVGCEGGASAHRLVCVTTAFVTDVLMLKVRDKETTIDRDICAVNIPLLELIKATVPMWYVCHCTMLFSLSDARGESTGSI
jgi:hypothetical protein